MTKKKYLRQEIEDLRRIRSQVMAQRDKAWQRLDVLHALSDPRAQVEISAATAATAATAVARCKHCDGRIEELVDEPAGNCWWVHESHPEDGHDAEPVARVVSS